MNEKELLLSIWEEIKEVKENFPDDITGFERWLYKILKDYFKGQK